MNLLPKRSNIYTAMEAFDKNSFQNHPDWNLVTRANLLPYSRHAASPEVTKKLARMLMYTPNWRDCIANDCEYPCEVANDCEYPCEESDRNHQREEEDLERLR